MRKTISVEALLDRCNHFFMHTEDSLKGNREGLIALIEGVLLDTGNYNGFGYLNEADMELSENGVSVGERHKNSREERFVDTDNTRVYYYK